MATVGNVYVFNATPNAMYLLLNNNIVGMPPTQLVGIQQSSNYAAQSTQVARNSSPGNPGNATFGGTNTLVVQFTGGTPQSYPVNIDPNQVQIGNDLQLYIFFNEVVIVTPTGSANQGGSTVVSAKALSPAEHEELVAQFGAISSDGASQTTESDQS